MGCCGSSSENVDKSTQLKTIKQPVSQMEEKVDENDWKKISLPEKISLLRFHPHELI